jgi:hypothetical protein
LCRLQRRFYCWKNSPKMVCALQARQFCHEGRSGRPSCASGGIWRGLSIIKCWRGIWPSLLNAIVNNFAVWIKQSSKNARVDDTEWFLSTTPNHTLQTSRKRPSRNSTGIFFHIALFSGPCPIGLPLLPLSLQQSAGSFLQQRRWAPKLARQLLHGQTGGFL